MGERDKRRVLAPRRNGSTPIRQRNMSADNGGRGMGVIEFIEVHRAEYLEELKEFLRIPSVSTRSEHKADIERAAHWVAEKLRAAGLENVEITPTKMYPLV